MEVALKDLLVAAGVGVFESASAADWGIWIGKEPKLPDQAVVIASSGGQAPDPKWLLDFPSYQIRIRGSKGNYASAKAKAKDVKDVLLGIQSQDINGERLVSITMSSDIAFIGYDENDRPHFSLNFRLITEPAASALSNREAL